MSRALQVLVACEESQVVTKAFRNLGHIAYSCDLQDCSGGREEWHIKGDAIVALHSQPWDLVIAHPPCTYLSVSGARWLKNKDGSRNEERFLLREEAVGFFRAIHDSGVARVALENPVSMLSSLFRKPDQTIQPYMFGDAVSKRTCLWLKGLPKLRPTNIVTPEKITNSRGNTYDKWWYDTCMISNREARAKARSKTFAGVANAMADQWSAYVLEQTRSGRV